MRSAIRQLDRARSPGGCPHPAEMRQVVDDAATVLRTTDPNDPEDAPLRAVAAAAKPDPYERCMLCLRRLSPRSTP